VGAWIHLRSAWEKAPADVDPDLSSADATVAQFCPDGSFTLIAGFVYRTGAQQSVGADLGLQYDGRWQYSNNELQVEAQLVYELIPALDRPRNRDLRLKGALSVGTLELDGLRYDRERALDVDSQSRCRRDPALHNSPLHQ
jgi:hypothetical protein